MRSALIFSLSLFSFSLFLSVSFSFSFSLFISLSLFFYFTHSLSFSLYISLFFLILSLFSLSLSFLFPRCGRCQDKSYSGRNVCPDRHTHEAARCIVIGHAHGRTKTVTVGDLEEDTVQGSGVVYTARTCAGTSGGLVLPLVYLEYQVGEGVIKKRQYVHSGATAVDRGHSTGTLRS